MEGRKENIRKHAKNKDYNTMFEWENSDSKCRSVNEPLSMN